MDLKIVKVTVPTLPVPTKIEYIKIYQPNGDHIQEKMQDNFIELDGITMNSLSVNMKQYKELKYLHVHIKLTEYGKSNWINASNHLLIPTNEFSINVGCEDEIKIIICETFGQGISFEVKKYNNDTKCSISTHQWLNSGTVIPIVAIRTKNNQLCNVRKQN